MRNKSYTYPVQLTLPIEFAPSVVRAHGLTVAHPRPLVSYGKDYGRVFCFRTSPRKAWRYAEVEYANAGSSYGALALDCDDADAYARGFLRSEIPPAELARVPPGHRPLTRGVDAGRAGAQVSEGATWATRLPHRDRGVLRPDAERGRRIQRRAGSQSYVSTDYETRWGPELPYPLEQLARVIPFGWRAPDVRQTGVGRNCDLFRAGMAWAGRKANARLDVLAALLIVNQRFAHSLPLSEVRTTARSIEKYRERWTARGWHAPHWLAKLASERVRGGIQSGIVRRAGSIEERQPWEAEDISRRTWFYRQAQARVALEVHQDKRGESGR